MGGKERDLCYWKQKIQGASKETIIRGKVVAIFSLLIMANIGQRSTKSNILIGGTGGIYI